MNSSTFPQTGFFSSLLNSFRYPFNGDGAYLIIAGAVMFTIADFVSAHASLMAIFIQLAVSGYLAVYAKDVARTSAMGEEKPPRWADFSDWIHDLAVPALEIVVMLALSFGPLIFLQFKHPFPADLETIIRVSRMGLFDSADLVPGRGDV